MSKAKKSQSRFTLPNYEGFPLLGWLVRWRVQHVVMPHEDFLAILKKHEIADSIAPKIIAKNAAIRATRDAAKGERFHRKVAERPTEAAFVIAATEVDDKLNTTFDTQTKIIFDKKTRSLLVSGDQQAKIKNSFNTFKESYTEDQVRAVIKRFVEKQCNAILYSEDGSYFIPATSQAAMTRLQDLFNTMSDFARLLPLPIIDTKAAKSGMWEAMVGDIQGDIKRLTADLEKRADLTGKMADDRIQKYQELRSKVEMYEVVLNGTADDLKASIAQLTETLKTKLTEG